MRGSVGAKLRRSFSGQQKEESRANLRPPALPRKFLTDERNRDGHPPYSCCSKQVKGGVNRWCGHCWLQPARSSKPAQHKHLLNLEHRTGTPPRFMIPVFGASGTPVEGGITCPGKKRSTIYERATPRRRYTLHGACTTRGEAGEPAMTSEAQRPAKLLSKCAQQN